MTISIAMATYNGAKYLQAQLDSFTSQTRLPDELIVCDDVSTDETLDILQKFLYSAPFKVVVFQNESNLGYTKNFEKAISLCTGDIIFLSDQDDVWFDNKLKTIEDIFLKAHDILVVINDQEITNEFLFTSGNTIYSNVHALGFNESWLGVGCATSFRSEFKNILIPFPENLIPHDTWIHRLALSFVVRRVIPDVLQQYRRHSDNSSSAIGGGIKKENMLTPIIHYGLKDATSGWRNEISISKYLILLINTHFEDFKKLNLSVKAEKVREFEGRRIKAFEDRISLMMIGRFRRWPKILKFYANGGYEWFSGWHSAFKDIVR